MKKLAFFITIIAMLSFSTSVESQTRLGVIFGLNQSTFDGQNEAGFAFVEYFNRGTGFTIGGLLEVKFIKNIDIQIEAMYEYNQVRAQLTTDEAGYNETINMNFGKLTFPAFVKIGFGNNKIRPHIMIGPYFSLNLHSKTQSKIENGTIIYRPLKQSLDSGFVFSIGLNFLMSKFALFLDLMYFHSPEASINDFIFFDENLKSRRKMIRLGFTIPR